MCKLALELSFQARSQEFVQGGRLSSPCSLYRVSWVAYQNVKQIGRGDPDL